MKNIVKIRDYEFKYDGKYINVYKDDIKVGLIGIAIAVTANSYFCYYRICHRTMGTDNSEALIQQLETLLNTELYPGENIQIPNELKEMIESIILFANMGA